MIRAGVSEALDSLLRAGFPGVWFPCQRPWRAGVRRTELAFDKSGPARLTTGI